MKKLGTIKKLNTILNIEEVREVSFDEAKTFITNNTAIGAVRSQKRLISNIVVCYDIETSKIKSPNGYFKNIIYSHQFAFWSTSTDEVMLYMVRDIEDAMEVFYFLESLYCEHLIYVHNLPYEFNNMFDFLFYDLDLSKSIFIANNKPIMLNTKYGVFRCSYKLSNASLATWSKNEEIKKSTLNYDVFRTPQTELSSDEVMYNLLDVYVMCSCLKSECLKYTSFRNNVETRLKIKKHRSASHPWQLPLTSTGYVRELVKDAFSSKNKDYIEELNSYSDQLWNAQLNAFRGGFVQASEEHVNEILNNLKHRDLTSAYPAVMATKLFPISKWTESPDSNICKPCTLSRVIFKNLQLKSEYQPYISLTNKVNTTGYCDLWNGKIKYAESLEICGVDVDFRIILRRYDYEEVQILESYRSEAGRLPKDLVACIGIIYELKCNTDKETEDYGLIKAVLNSIYGMSAQSPLFDIYSYTEDGVTAIDKELKITTLPYQWALYTTAYPREIICGFADELKDKFVYADTDSIFYIRDSKFEKHVEEYNENCMLEVFKAAKDLKIPANILAPTKKYLGTFTVEHEKIDKFITMGCKRYILESDGIKEATIAGLSNTKPYKCNGNKLSGLAIKYIEHITGKDIFESIHELGVEASNILIPPKIGGKKVVKIIRGQEVINGYNTYTSQVIEGIPTLFGYENSIQNTLNKLLTV